jgi:imidazolonepropionase-like amidohydrolase
MLRHWVARTAAIALMGACAGCATPGASGTADVYHGFTLIDPATEARVRDAYVVVDKGVIRRVGRGRPPASSDPARRHDLTGRFVLPGFIDAHAHITASGIQTVELRDGKPVILMESDDEITRHNARVALSRGVTTVRNPGGDTEANARYDRMIASGAWIGPEAKHAGEVIEPPPLAGGMYAYPRTEAEWQAEARRQAHLGMTYFKLYMDLSEAELATGIRVAHQHGLKAIAHLNSVSWTRAAELGIDGLEHALPTSPDLLGIKARETYVAGLGRDSKYMYRWFELADLDGPEIDAMTRALAGGRIPVALTLVVNEIVYNTDDLDRAYPASERADMRPEVLRSALSGLRMSATGWTAEDYRRARAVMPKVLAFARLLHERGVPLMVGTDAGGGLFYARELELHRQAGIPAWAVLRMATSDAARIMGLERRIGRIQTGLEADLVILQRDPVLDLGAASEVAGVISDGRYYPPSDLKGARAGAR